MTDGTSSSPSLGSTSETSPSELSQSALPGNIPPAPGSIDAASPGQFAASRKQHGLACTWWTACTLWAYFVFGELVVAADYPEALAAIGVVAGVAVAGRRVSFLFDDSKAVVIGAALTSALSVVCVLVGPAVLLAVFGQRYVALLGLLLAVAVALTALRFVRRRERSSHEQTRLKPALASVVTWLLVFAFTAVTVALSAKG